MMMLELLIIKKKNKIYSRSIQINVVSSLTKHSTISSSKLSLSASNESVSTSVNENKVRLVWGFVGIFTDKKFTKICSQRNLQNWICTYNKLLT